MRGHVSRLIALGAVAGLLAITASGALADAVVAPFVTHVPALELATGQVNANVIPGRVTWQTAPGTNPVASSHVSRSVDGGAWATVATTAGSSLPAKLTLGHSYRYRVQADDGQGNRSVQTPGPVSAVKLKDDGGTAAVWTGSWKKVSSSTAIDRTLHSSASGTASVTLRFTGRSVAVIAPAGPSFAGFDATMDGDDAGPVSTSASAVSPRHVVFVYSFNVAGQHTLTLDVERSSGHSVAQVDGFVVLG